MSNSSIWPIDRTLSGATTLSQSGPESADDEEVLYIPQSPSIIGTSPSDYSMVYPEYSLGALTFRDEVSVFYSPSRLGWKQVGSFSLFLFQYCSQSGLWLSLQSEILIGWLIGWVYGISNFIDYSMPNSFLFK